MILLMTLILMVAVAGVYALLLAMLGDNAGAMLSALAGGDRHYGRGGDSAATAFASRSFRRA